MRVSRSKWCESRTQKSSCYREISHQGWMSSTLDDLVPLTSAMALSNSQVSHLNEVRSSRKLVTIKTGQSQAVKALQTSLSLTETSKIKQVRETKSEKSTLLAWTTHSYNFWRSTWLPNWTSSLKKAEKSHKLKIDPLLGKVSHCHRRQRVALAQIEAHLWKNQRNQQD